MNRADDLVERAVEWLRQQPVEPCPPDLVLGTDDAERRSLAALGGIARGVCGTIRKSWPAPIRDWMEGAPHPPPALAAEIRKSLSGGTDALGAVYEGVVSGRSRRRLGTVFTPPGVVEYMLTEAEKLTGTPATVIDPGAGVGAFTLAARNRWPKARVIAVDVNAATLGLLAARCAHERLPRVTLVLEDFLSWMTDSEPEAGPRLVVGNPPYTRSHELPKKLRDEARCLSGDLVMSGLAGLSAYFLAVSLRNLGPRDALSFLLPGSWAESRYGAPLRRFLWEAEGRAVRMSAFPADSDLFPGTRVTAMVLTVSPERTKRQNLTTCGLRVGSHSVRRNRPSSHDRTMEVPSTFGLLLWPRAAPPPSHGRVCLQELGRVRRGVATGANHFFFLTESQRARLPAGATRPALCRMRHVDGTVLTGEVHARIAEEGHRCWLLCLSKADVVGHPEVKALIESGEDEGLQRRRLTSSRHPWYLVEDVPPPDLILGPMSKRVIRTIVNEIGAIPSNAMYGIYLVNRRIARPLANWLNGLEGQQALRLESRQYGGGLFKLEPKDVLRVLVPDGPFWSSLD